MKHSICGFNHAALLLNFKCDYDDAQILSCIVGFRDTGKMKEITVNEKKYFWVYYQWIIEQLPGLRCRDKRSLARRMDRYVNNGLMEKHVEQGNSTYYRFIEKQLEILQSYPCEKFVTPGRESTTPLDVKVQPPGRESTTPLDVKVQPPGRESTTIDSSLIIKRKKEDKKKVSPLLNESNNKYLPLSEYLLKKIKDSGTDAVFKESDIGKWNNHFRLIIEQDGRSEGRIRAKIDEVFEDQFWSKQIRSAGTLREKWKLGRLDRLGENKKTENDDEETAPEAPKTPFQRFKGNTTLTDSEVVLSYLYRQWEAIYGDKGWREYNFPSADSTTEALYREIWEVYRGIKDKKQAFDEIFKRFKITPDQTERHINHVVGSSVENEEW
jgi:hypothetical protein